jgi:hypothetical protein
MDGLGAAASVIAVVELSAKVAKLCVQYSREVKGARNEIARLHSEVNKLKTVVEDVQNLINRLDKGKLSASQKVVDAIDDCLTQLKELDKRMDPGTTRKAMSRFGVRALRWPFDSKEVDKVIGDLERCKGMISLALQVDQT